MGVLYSWHLAAVVEHPGHVPPGLEEIVCRDYDHDETMVGRELWQCSEEYPGEAGLTGAMDPAELRFHIGEVSRLAGRPARLVWFLNKS